MEFSRNSFHAADKSIVYYKRHCATNCMDVFKAEQTATLPKADIRYHYPHVVNSDILNYPDIDSDS